MLSDSFAPIHGDLNSDEIDKLAEFQIEFMSAPASTRQEMIKEALEVVLQDDLLADRLLGVVSYAGEHGDMEEKEAVAQLLPMMKTAGADIDKEAAFPGDEEYKSSGSVRNMIQPALAAMAAAPFISKMMRGARTRRHINQSAQSIYDQHPELRDDPHSASYFNAIRDFAPSLAANPLVAGNVMKAMHQVGPGFVTPKVLKELLDVQEQYDKQQSGPADALSGLSKVKLT